MNIKIVLNQPYPQGMACTNRLHHYAKGLQELGHHPEIIVPIPLERKREAKNHAAAGQHEGISFWYAGSSPYRSHHFLSRRIGDILNPLRAAYRIVRAKPKTGVILLVSNSIFHIVLFKVAAIASGALYVQEKSELPFAFSKTASTLTGLYRKFYNRTVYRFFDGMVVISEQLRTFFQPLVSNSAELLLVPVIVDVAEFSEGDSPLPTEPYIAYAGNLSNHKDGIDTLIEAFSHMVGQHDVKLYLIGKPAASAQKRVEALIEKYQLQSQVILTGYVSREALVDYVRGARALALAKPDNTQANFCFPSKLGEYLASSRPVVTTKVGEIPSYLEDGRTALLATPDDPSSFAEKLSWVLSHSEEATQIGKQGQELAREKFSYQIQGQRLANFMQSLRNRKA